MQLIVKNVACTLAVLLLVSVGCGTTAPSPSPARSHAAQVTSSPAFALPSATPSPTPSGAAAPLVEDLAVDAHRVAGEYSGHITAIASLGHEIVWAGGRNDTDNNLYRYVPGEAEPELLFLNPRRDSVVTSVAGSATGYVFSDERWAGDQPRGWRLWYLAAGESEPVLLDQSTDDRLPSPTLAMNDRHIAWEVVHGSWDDRTNELRLATASDATEGVTILSKRGIDSYMEYPSLWSDELWYGVVDNDWNAGVEYPRVEMIDLGNPSAAPEVFGADQRAFMPAPGREVVAWKGGGMDGSSALNSGTLTIYWRASGAVDTLPIPGPGNAANRISYPSVGNRFITWWEDIHPRFYVYDLVDRRFRRIAEYDWAGNEAVFMQSLSADLLAYVHSTGDGDSYLEWALLPR